MQKYTSSSVMRALRIIKSISQKEMAKIMCVSEQQISMIETDKRGFTFDFLTEYLINLNVVSDLGTNLNMFARIRFDEAQKQDRFAIHSAICKSVKSESFEDALVKTFIILKQLSDLKLSDIASNIGRSFSYVDYKIADKDILSVVGGLGITYEDICDIATGNLDKSDLVYEFFKKSLVKNQK